MENAEIKRKTGKSSLETKTDADMQELLEDDIVNERDLTAFSTLSEEERTAMSKLFKSMA